MDVIRTVIVDDEELCRRGLRLLLARDPAFEIVGECGDGERAVDDIRRLKPDLVFLDIRMPRGSGFDVVRRIPADELPLIVFVTAFDDHAVRAFEIHAVDYVLKPFARARFLATLAHVKARIRDHRASRFGLALVRMVDEWHHAGPADQGPVVDHRYLDRLIVVDRDGETVVQVPDIEWIEGADYYVHLHARQRSYLHRERLKNLERRLPPDRFVRVHKSAIVNIDCIERVVTDARQHDHVVLRCGATVPVSRLRRAALKLLIETRRSGATDR